MIAFVLFLVFLFLALLHFLWALGLEWGLDGAYPSNPDGPSFKAPGKLLTLLVAICLCLPASYYLDKTVDLSLPAVFNYFKYIIPVLFLIRAIGEFKYVGLFKTVKHTLFAKRDTNLYTPLCLVISMLSLIDLMMG